MAIGGRHGIWAAARHPARACYILRAVNVTPPSVRVFRTHEEARDAIRALTAAGVKPETIGVLARSAAEVHRLEQQTGAATATENLDAEAGHDVLGEVVDVLGSIESLLVPGFGGVLVTGDLIPHISAVLDDIRESGAIKDTLVSLGVSADEAADLERAVADGQILVVVNPPFQQRA
jgi:hypothetical protein